MYAIINTGGKQAKVRAGDVLHVELLHTDDETIDFEPILVVDDGSVISDPTQLSKLAVSARIVGDAKGPKIDIFKYKNKTGYRRRMGHRQKYTEVEVLSIGSTRQEKMAAKGGAAKTGPSKSGTSDATASNTDTKAVEPSSEEE